MPLDNVYQLAGVRLDAARADGLELSLNLAYTDHAPALLRVRHSVLHVFPDRQAEDADATLSLSAMDLKLLLCDVTTADALLEEGRLAVDGDTQVLSRLLALLDRFPRWFPIVTPRATVA